MYFSLLNLMQVCSNPEPCFSPPRLRYMFFQMREWEHQHPEPRNSKNAVSDIAAQNSVLEKRTQVVHQLPAFALVRSHAMGLHSQMQSWLLLFFSLLKIRHFHLFLKKNRPEELVFNFLAYELTCVTC